MATNKKSTRFTKAENPKDKFIKFYLNEEEYAEVKQQVDGLNGMTLSKYCRYHVLGKKIVSDNDEKLIYELVRLGGQLSKLGGLQKDLFNFSPAGQINALRTSKVLDDISIALYEITALVERVKNEPFEPKKIVMGG